MINDLTTCYGSIEAVRGVSLAVPKGEVVAILGANGAGKSTLLHTISGLLRPKAGSVIYKGMDITHLAPEKITARGMCQVPEGRRLFRELSVQDNLVVGVPAGRTGGTLTDDIAYVYELFPILGERRSSRRVHSPAASNRCSLSAGPSSAGRNFFSSTSPPWVLPHSSWSASSRRSRS